MRILFAFNAFKGCMTAQHACETAARAAAACGHEARVCPMADGGDGTAEILREALRCQTIPVAVHGPLADTVIARYGWDFQSKTAIMEMAAASGIALLPASKLDPIHASTFGTGEMIRHAIVQKKARKIIIGLGGSATVDGGAGAAQALGWKFFDQNGALIPDGIGGGELTRIISANCPVGDDAITTPVDIQLLCDVRNPLLGDNGAAAIFGPQKGATPQQVQLLEDALVHWMIRVINRPDVAAKPAAGAAGGLAAGLVACCGAQFANGAETVANMVGLKKNIEWADIVVTGEGQLDEQTLMGKAPAIVIENARNLNKPIVVAAGRVTLDEQDIHQAGINKALQITPSNTDLATALRDAAKFLAQSITDFLATQTHNS